RPSSAHCLPILSMCSCGGLEPASNSCLHVASTPTFEHLLALSDRVELPVSVDAPAAVAGDRAALADMKLRPLAVELGLGDVPPILKAGRVTEALAQHEGIKGTGGTPRANRTRADQTACQEGGHWSMMWPHALAHRAAARRPGHCAARRRGGAGG